MNTLLFLGTGASLGVPVIGCQCPACQSNLKYNHRFRTSALLTINQKKILIDCGPDFRQQALQHKINTLDGIILTHAHNDHTAGLDDLRAFFYQRTSPLPLLLSEETHDEILKRFDYLFRPSLYVSMDQKFTIQKLLDKQGETIFDAIKINYMTYEQGGMQVNGFRFNDLAYLSDIKIYNEALFDSLIGVKKLIISALRFTPSPLHFTVDEAVDFASKVRAEEVWLTHISHDLEHEKVNAYLPDHVNLAYDGLTISFG